jgi:hypothetical protein
MSELLRFRLLESFDLFFVIFACCSNGNFAFVGCHTIIVRVFAIEIFDPLHVYEAISLLIFSIAETFPHAAE